MHPFDLLRGQALDDEQLIVAAIELGARLARRIDLDGLGAGERFAVLDIVDAEAFAQITKDERTVLFDLEVGRHIFSVSGGGGGRGGGRVRRTMSKLVV